MLYLNRLNNLINHIYMSMKNSLSSNQQLSPFMQYLASLPQQGTVRIPPLTELSRVLGISIASLREQMEVARTMGIIEVHPRTGIQRLPFTFVHAAASSLAYSVACDEENFSCYADFRKHVESAYWRQAVSLLTEEDIHKLKRLVHKAQDKLNRKPPQIPHEEHKELHLSIYHRLNNPFVSGVLEAYWLMYEDTGLAVFLDLSYLEQVWLYHQKMVEAIAAGDLDQGHKYFLEHMEMLSQRTLKDKRHRFE